MFKFLFLATIAVNLMTTSSARANGAVSGGGGSLTDPVGVKPELISGQVGNYIGTALTAWFQTQQYKYEFLKPDLKSKSPFRKILGVSDKFYRLVRETSVEFRLTGPCLDSNGAAFDGSIYAASPNVICISAKTIAPKLNRSNLRPEVIALIAHEYSHLVGTSEDDAVKIQNLALADFYTTDFQALKVDVADLHTLLSLKDLMRGYPFPLTILGELKNYIDGSADEFSAVQITKLYARLEQIAGYILPLGKKIKIVPLQFAQKLGLDEALIGVSQAYLCTADATVSEAQRKNCANYLEILFPSGAETLSARTWRISFNDSYCAKAPNFCFGLNDSETIKRPKSKADAMRLLGPVYSDMSAMRDSMNVLLQCDYFHGDVNCGEQLDPPAAPATRIVTGFYNDAGNTMTCEGTDGGRYLRNATCKAKTGPGILASSILGFYRVQLRESSSKAVMWDCTAKRENNGTGDPRTDLHHAYCTLRWDL